MSTYKLILDESGSFKNKNERFFLLGGLFFDTCFEKELENSFRPLFVSLTKAFGVNELHAKENRKYFRYICAPIGCNTKIMPIIYIIDKEQAYVFKNYEKKDNSFYYNKMIEHLVCDMKENKLFKSTDFLQVRIDNININEEGKRNLSSYLPQKLNFISMVEESDSKNYITLQFADIIVNKFSKKEYINIDDCEIKLLNPKIMFFLKRTQKDYIKTNNDLKKEIV